MINIDYKKKYRIYSCEDKLVWKRFFESVDNVESVPVLNKEFLEIDIESAVKQALHIIMDYLIEASLNIKNISVEDGYNCNTEAKYIIFKNNNGSIECFFKLEEIE